MKKIYHLCLSGGEEIIFRDLEDYHRGFNCFAVALHKSESTGLVESFMSTHTHLMIQSGFPKDLMFYFRHSYAKYFNDKYQREGKLGERKYFTLEVVGYNHILAAMSYVLRNPLHHGVAPIPYAYHHSSANAIFREAMGKHSEENLLPQKSFYKYLGSSAVYPDRYKMHSSGVFVRDSVLDIPQVEALYGTPRAFNYFMTRKSSEEWEREQHNDKLNAPPLKLETIEQGVRMHTVDTMLKFENGKADYRLMTDIELCTLIDKIARERYGKNSVYQLTVREQNLLANEIYAKYKISPIRIRRCLVIK